MHHSLLPRSTGLLACLRALAPKISDLQLVDLTIGYEGVPQDGYGQDYYTLASFFGAGDAPVSLPSNICIESRTQLMMTTASRSRALPHTVNRPDSHRPARQRP